jgi:hypothetical protein
MDPSGEVAGAQASPVHHQRWSGENCAIRSSVPDADAGGKYVLLQVSAITRTCTTQMVLAQGVNPEPWD